MSCFSKKPSMPKAEEMSYSRDILVCEKCKERYSDKLRDALNGGWNSFIEKATAEREEDRKLNSVKAKERKLDALRDEVRALNEKIKELE